MTKGPNLGRHAAECKICSHPERGEIERDFINWRSPAAIAKEYKLGNRKIVYRHAHALDLFPKRQRNIRAALEKLIERAGEVDVNVIRGWLGHVSLDSTNRYAEITVRAKEAALRLCEPPPSATDSPGPKPVWRDDEALLAWLASL